MIIFKGWGVLAFILPIIFSLIIQLVVNHYYGEGFYKSENWPIALAFLISALPVFLVGYKLNKTPGRLLIDPLINEEVILKKQHSFFWIPLQHWAVILIILSGLLYFEDRIWA